MASGRRGESALWMVARAGGAGEQGSGDQTPYANLACLRQGVSNLGRSFGERRLCITSPRTPMRCGSSERGEGGTWASPVRVAVGLASALQQHHARTPVAPRDETMGQRRVRGAADDEQTMTVSQGIEDVAQDRSIVTAWAAAEIGLNVAGMCAPNNPLGQLAAVVQRVNNAALSNRTLRAAWRCRKRTSPRRGGAGHGTRVCGATPHACAAGVM